LPDGKYAVVERDDVAIHLFQDDTQCSAVVGVHVFTQDIETLFAELQRRGAHVSQGILRKPWGSRDLRVHDNSGNEIKFTEPA
jgi:uncharacterized glyoxalase superfamily protein PhnB